LFEWGGALESFKDSIEVHGNKIIRELDETVVQGLAQAFLVFASDWKS